MKTEDKNEKAYTDPTGQHRISDSGASGVASPIPTKPAGPLETEVFERARRAALRYRRFLAKQATSAKTAITGATASGFRGLRAIAKISDRFDDLDETETVSANEQRRRVGAAVIATRLLFARAIDSVPGLLETLRTKGPVVTVQVTDVQVLDRLRTCWSDVIFPREKRIARLGSADAPAADTVAFYCAVQEEPKAREKEENQKRALAALSFPVPTIAFSSAGATYLPEAINKAAHYRIEMPKFDAAIIRRTIKVVTGKACRAALPPDVVADVALDDLIIAIRSDRSPSECVAELRRLHGLKVLRKQSRDLSLDQLHGLGEVRAWADATLADLKAWKNGTIPWSAVQSAICLVGPPGTGKTTFGRVFASAAGFDFRIGTLAAWQGAGDGHLGHLLRAMREDFAQSRSRATVFLIDEVDGFAERATINHSHKDYVVQVVNAMLTEIDAAKATEGVVLIACTNDETRCDPALLRAGRLNPIVRIGLPNALELERMLRVRLGKDLLTDDLCGIAELAIGMTGADVEKLVNDAKRLARVAGRSMVASDLVQAMKIDDDRSPAMLWRTAAHEAGHIVCDIVLTGMTDVFATIAATHGSWGSYTRSSSTFFEGTIGEYKIRLQVALAGRAAEQLLLSSISHGAGGSFDSDLSFATDLACVMVSSVGLAGSEPLVFLGPMNDARKFLAFDHVRAAVNSVLSEAESACTALLERHREGLQEVAKVLLTTGRISGSDVAEILGRFRGRSRLRSPGADASLGVGDAGRNA